MWSINKAPIGDAVFPGGVCALPVTQGDRFGYGPALPGGEAVRRGAHALKGESVLTRVRMHNFGALAPYSWRPPV